MACRVPDCGVSDLPGVLKGECFRRTTRKLPVESFSALKTDAEMEDEVACTKRAQLSAELQTRHDG